VLGVALILFVLVQSTLEAARAEFAKEPARRSAVLAWFRGVRTLALHPGRLVLCVLFSVLGALLGYGVVVARLRLNSAGFDTEVTALLSGPLASAALIWAKIGRLSALSEAAKTDLPREPTPSEQK
jgi:hypothetical protein